MGEKHCLALGEGGRLFGWGINSNGELLLREKVEVSRVIQLSDLRFREVRCVGTVSYMLTADCELHYSGVSGHYQSY